MSLQQQLASDLERVFFSDFAQAATVDGKPVRGTYRDSPHEFDAIQGAARSFSAPSGLLAAARRNSVVVISNVGSFRVTGSPVRVSGITYLPLDPL